MIAVLVVLIVVVIVFCGLIVLAQGDAKHTGPSSQASGTPVVEGDLTYTSNTIVFGVPSRVVNHLCFFADGDSFTGRCELKGKSQWRRYKPLEVFFFLEWMENTSQTKTLNRLQSG